MNSEFVERIEEPRKLQLQRLQESARDAVTERLDQYRIRDVPDCAIRRLTYAYFHDWKRNDPSYVFLLADPGVPGEHVVFETNEYVELSGGSTLRDAVEIDQRFGARWLAKREYTNFTEAFVESCKENGLITTDGPWWQYLLSGEFFDDFYMTDVVKHRAPNPSSADVNASFTEYLIHELEYVEPDIVFAFGKRAWDTLREQLGARPVAEAPESPSILNAHGVLHETDRLVQTSLLPLGHPSPNFRGAQISHDEYVDRLRRGIEQWTVEC